jgi:cytoskeletal protein RodZ
VANTEYPLNPHPFSQAPLKQEEHQRVMLGLLYIFAVIAIIGGYAYWRSASSSLPPKDSMPALNHADIKTQLLLSLQNSPKPAPAEIDMTAKELSKSKPASPEEKSAVLDQLRGNTI